jgi:hypothetical protein
MIEGKMEEEKNNSADDLHFYLHFLFYCITLAIDDSKLVRQTVSLSSKKIDFPAIHQPCSYED